MPRDKRRRLDTCTHLQRAVSSARLRPDDAFGVQMRWRKCDAGLAGYRYAKAGAAAGCASFRAHGEYIFLSGLRRVIARDQKIYRRDHKQREAGTDRDARRDNQA